MYSCGDSIFPDGDWTRRLDGPAVSGNDADEGLPGEEGGSGSSLSWTSSSCRSMSSEMRVKWRGAAGVEISWPSTLGGFSLFARGTLRLILDLTWPIVIADRLAALVMSNCINK